MICDVITSGELDAYASGELGPAAARTVEAHLFGCPACAAELKLLRAERRLLRARAESDEAPVPSFEGVLARLEAQPPARPRLAPVNGGTRQAVASAAMVVLAAAAAATLWLRADHERPAAATAPRTDETIEITPEAVCKDDGLLNDEPRSSVSVAPEPESAMDRAVARIEEDKSVCLSRASEVCGSAEAPMTNACDDGVAWCSVGRP